MIVSVNIVNTYCLLCQDSIIIAQLCRQGASVGRLYLCLTEEDSGILMSSMCIVILYCREEGEWGRVQCGGGGLEMGSWLWARDRQGRGFAAMYKEPPFQVRGLFFHWLYITIHVCSNILIHNVCVSDIKKKNNSSVQVKNKPRVENRNMHLFLAQWSMTS